MLMADNVVVVDDPTIAVVAVRDAPAVQVAGIGIQGPKGEPGIPGPPGDPTTLGYTYTTSNPALKHIIHHPLPYNPGGIFVRDADGETVLGYTVEYPVVGTIEITFGSPITPHITVS